MSRLKQHDTTMYHRNPDATSENPNNPILKQMLVHCQHKILLLFWGHDTKILTYSGRFKKSIMKKYSENSRRPGPGCHEMMQLSIG
jgi:hypothetical protein